MVTVNKLSVIQVYLPNSKFLKPIIEAKASNIVDDPEACYISAMVEVEYLDSAEYTKTCKFPTFVKVPWLPVDSAYLNKLMETFDRNKVEDELVMYVLNNIDGITDIYTTLLTDEPDFAQSFNEAVMYCINKHNVIKTDKIDWNF